jgi:hypothetical protein
MTLQEVDVPVISQQQCQLQLQQTRLGYDYKLHPGMICAGGEEGKDACKVTHTFSKTFLGPFPKLRKVTLSIVMSVSRPVCMEELRSLWTDFHGI